MIANQIEDDSGMSLRAWAWILGAISGGSIIAAIALLLWRLP